jgi:hypothetical protein
MPPVSVIQIFYKDSKKDIDFRKIIKSNSEFLEMVKVEYIVYDNLNEDDILRSVKDYNFLKYYRKKFKNLKTSFQESSIFANGSKIIFLKPTDILNMDNVQQVENDRPSLLKNNLKTLDRISHDNINFENFKLLVKDEKNFLEKIQSFWYTLNI